MKDKRVMGVVLVADASRRSLDSSVMAFSRHFTDSLMK